MSIFDMYRDALGIKKKLRRIYPAGEVATYDSELKCGNCDEEFIFAIPKSTTIDTYIQQTKCPNCETKNLKKGKGKWY